MCFETDDELFAEPNLLDGVGYGGLVGCLAEYQSSAQTGYLFFMMFMLPVLLVAAYIGWVLPDVYIAASSKEQPSVDSFLDSMSTSVDFANPIDEVDEEDEGTANYNIYAEFSIENAERMENCP